MPKRARLPGDGPRGSFKEFVDWVLFYYGFHFIISEIEEAYNATIHATHFVPPAATVPTDVKPVLTTDAEPELMPEPYNAQRTSLTRCVSQQHHPSLRGYWWNMRGWCGTLFTSSRDECLGLIVCQPDPGLLTICFA